jgi:uncharacterized protein YciI
MSEEKEDKIAEPLKPMLKKRLFVALSKAVAQPEQMLPFVAEHLEYMNRLENEGKLFASGPFIQEGVLVGDGLTIPQSGTLEEAHALSDHRRRRRANLHQAIGGTHRQPHEERYEIPKHRTLYSCGRSTTRPAEPDPTLR